MDDNIGELPPELAEFIDRLIVPLLVERLINDGHLYSAEGPRYDERAAGLQQAA